MGDGSFWEDNALENVGLDEGWEYGSQDHAGSKTQSPHVKIDGLGEQK